MDGDDGDEHERGQRHTDHGDQRANQHGESADQLDNNGRPSHEFGPRHAKSVKCADKIRRSSRNLCVTVRHEAVAHQQAQRNGGPAFEREVVGVDWWSGLTIHVVPLPERSEGPFPSRPIGNSCRKYSLSK
jgi:hypothetical protein